MAENIITQSDDSHTRTMVFSVRVTFEENAALLGMMEEHGVRHRNAMIRALIRAGSGLLVADKEQVSAWQSMAGALVQAGNNINQMARLAHRGDLGWGAEERAEMRDLRRQCGALVPVMKGFCDAVQSRTRTRQAIARALKLVANAR